MNRKPSNGSAAPTPLPNRRSRPPRERRQRLTRQERVTQAHPHPPAPGARGSSSQRISIALGPKLGSSEPSSAKRTAVPASSGEALVRPRARRPRPPRPAPRRRPRRRSPARVARSRGTRAPPHPPWLDRGELTAQLLHAPPGSHHARRQLQRREWDRAQELEAEAPDRSSEPGSARSNAPASKAAGAPPCSARGSHGPRACSVGCIAMVIQPSAAEMVGAPSPHTPAASAGATVGEEDRLGDRAVQLGSPADEVAELAGVAQRGAVPEERQLWAQRGEPACGHAVAGGVGGDHRGRLAAAPGCRCGCRCC